ncbi:putative Uncharacterized transposase-like protein [Monocercomonoides exilis]|uniref:putative Uncharacterized transposase-like protein n=1 Tax=Monocercomonoides exilis TaxID=2049356 RepID=UPI00355A1D21|nr:putative Uncharacterized transposase-like protein [Monocercomonoides exilis]|eukprot:MONOS_3784.1-p1 / transcript=MONOS_3784.1 / gene=MONOS_3784 / organism=Monocercomonoides_exilis_PA203 / gene_product=Uncharacterized transposase-like protein HI1328.1 / transcript_product=Uncharacterized transposase-like protein HI1328.1 / location=Mono_scaffold00092:93329-94084(-) / protein_length=151 / sequence_SO=supercontig / SO=protein_coding / is_pseudo=false
MIGKYQTPIGGPGSIVEIDEAVWSRQKYKRGRAKKQIWIFGARERGGKAFVYPVSNKSASVLIPFIKKHIRPGTEISSDQWKAYSSLSENGLTHWTVNNSEHFVEYKALEEEAFGPEEKEEETGSEILHEEESSESEYELETDHHLMGLGI